MADEQTGSHPSKGAEIKLDLKDLASIDRCATEATVRNFESSLYIRGEESSELVVPMIKYAPLDTCSHEARLLKLHPTDDASKHVRCNLEVHPVTRLPPFIAIQNARGYRKLEEAIEVDGKALLISVALERFLRYLRTRITEPTRIWARYTCVVQSDPQEQKAYWTRDFSNYMYGLASEVFDMHEINSHLIENGYFEKVIDSRHMEWEKQWYGPPNQMVLPQVCPVRLGTNPDNNEPTMEYKYMPLDMIADEIRIICIMPAEDSAAPIVMHVAHCPIKCEVTFIALSYRWGTDLTTEQVVLNGQTKLIRKNLADAIRFIRTPDMIVPLWIDAISINQDDIIERGRQVKRMGQIYNNAMAVYSWLDIPTDDIEEVLFFMNELEKHPIVRVNHDNEFHFGEWGSRDGDIWYGENTIKPSRLVKLCTALYRFLTNQYFRRAWILQEVARASNPIIVAHKKMNSSFGTLDKAAYNLLSILERDPSLVGEMQNSDHSLGVVGLRLLAYSRKLFYFRYLASKGEGGGSLIPFHTFQTNTPGFLEALVLTRDFECTDPRDRIFALWNLAQDKNDLDFKPEYSMSYEQVYMEFTQAWIVQHGLLDILGAVETTQESASFYRISPSWCPNWAVPATASCLVRKDYLPTRSMMALGDHGGKLYSTGGTIDRVSFDHPLYIFEGKALHCTGIVIDQIKLSFDDAPEIPAGTASRSTWKFHYWTDAIRRYFQKHSLAIYDDPVHAAWAMFHGDSIDAWVPNTGSGYHCDASDVREHYTCLPAVSRHVPRFSDSYSRTEAWSAVDSVIRGRRPFVTENGYIGLAPDYITESAVEADGAKNSGEQPIWLLAVAAGCSVPLLLREKEDETYQLIGTCFVQGWMDGEWIETMMGVESPKEFWEFIGDSAKLVIT